jgi:hypothetical protein
MALHVCHELARGIKNRPCLKQHARNFRMSIGARLVQCRHAVLIGLVRIGSVLQK